MTLSVPEELITALMDRIDAFAQERNRERILNPQALSEARDLLNFVADTEPDLRVNAIAVVAWLRWSRYLASNGQSQDDLDAAIRLFSRIGQINPQAVPPKLRPLIGRTSGDTDPFRVAQTGIELLRRAENQDDPEALDQGIAQLAAVAAATPNDDPFRAAVLANLTVALRIRFERAGDIEDLDEAIQVARQAVRATSEGHPDHAADLSNLATAMQRRFERTGEDFDLQEAIRLAREAIKAAPDDHRDRPAYLSNLGASLRVRFENTGVIQDLDEATCLAREAVEASTDDQFKRAMYTSNLAGMLYRRFEQTGRQQDVDEAISLVEEAIEATGGHLYRATMLANLGAMLRDRFQHTGAEQDLDEAVRLGRQAIEAMPQNHPDRAMQLSNVGSSLLTRFLRTGSTSDLDEAIQMLQEAAATFPRDQPLRAGCLSNLGTALRTRFEHTEHEADLDEAIQVTRHAVEATTPDGHVSRAGYLADLSSVLLRRAQRTGSEHDLDEAIQIARRAVEMTPDGHPNKAGMLSNLGGSFKTRFEQTGAAPDLDEAIRMSRSAVSASVVEHPDYAMYLSNLSSALYARFERTKRQQDVEEAVAGWVQASQSAVAPVSTRLAAAESWGQALSRWRGPAAAAEAYTAAVALLPLLTWRGISGHDQRRLLSTHGASLARDGAACAIDVGHLGLAVELLEAGRGVYWSQLLGTRTDLTALEQVAPELAKQLHGCRASLDQPALGDHTGSSTALAVEGRIRAARLFDRLVEQVRALPPTEPLPHPDRFLKSPRLDTLLPGTEDTIVVINISRWRCDALILTHDGVNLAALPDLTEEQVNNEAARYLWALLEFERGNRTRTDRINLETAITAALQWMWDHIAEPILHLLGRTSTPDGVWPRLQWCLTGALSILPLHAAGYHQNGDTVLDRVVSSYTPTVRAVADARNRNESTHPAKILIIALPETPDQDELPGTAAELGQLATLFTDETRSVLVGAEATRENILAKLGAYRWLHASCHGFHRLTDPMAGGLLPYDWKTAGLITIADLISPDHVGGEFAFLSACKTATGDVGNLDEVITIAVAMQHAGWRHVIGTLWSVWDHSATAIALNLYGSLVRDAHLDPSLASYALHHTVRKLRDIYPESPSSWAPFIHVGP